MAVKIAEEVGVVPESSIVQTSDTASNVSDSALVLSFSGVQPIGCGVPSVATIDMSVAGSRWAVNTTSSRSTLVR